jgi:hypothetical protein
VTSRLVCVAMTLTGQRLLQAAVRRRLSPTTALAVFGR